MRYQFTHIRMDKTEKIDNVNYKLWYGATGTFRLCWENEAGKKMVQHCYRSVDYTELHTYKGRKKELDTGYQTNLNGSKLSAAFPVFAYSMG